MCTGLHSLEHAKKKKKEMDTGHDKDKTTAAIEDRRGGREEEFSLEKMHKWEFFTMFKMKLIASLKYIPKERTPA